MSAITGRGSRRSINIWPGFVDALGTLLLVVVFVLMIFLIAQFALSVALTGKDEALSRLQREINEMAELLALERSANIELRSSLSQLSGELQSSLAAREALADELNALRRERDDLNQQIQAMSAERESLADQLASVIAQRDEAREAQSELAARSSELAAERDALAEDRDSLARQRASLAEERDRLQEEQATVLARAQELERELTEAEAERARLAAMLERTQTELTKVSAELEDAFKVIEADKAKIEAQLAEIAIMQELRQELADELAKAEAGEAQQAELAERAQAEVALLNRQIAALRQQLARLSATLEAAEAENREQKVQIADLGRRLNVALANKVQELARYRSEFFGRLRQILGSRQDVRVVGDRFVFQSEVLFDSASAELERDGRQQLASLADALKEIAAEIPKDLDWILRVDGHTDPRPISTPEFPSNWELSTARAISVVRFLIEQGVPPHRLAATGFADYQPLDPGDDEIAYRRNRRIELKLTQR